MDRPERQRGPEDRLSCKRYLQGITEAVVRGIRYQSRLRVRYRPLSWHLPLYWKRSVKYLSKRCLSASDLRGKAGRLALPRGAYHQARASVRLPCCCVRAKRGIKTRGKGGAYGTTADLGLAGVFIRLDNEEVS